MAVYAKKDGDESNDALQQRFKKQVQKTGLLKLLRERSRFKKTKTKRVVRNRAVMCAKYRREKDKKQFYSNM